ncbi:MAG: MMPL family transporter, partial [Acidobacteriota bacterium]|nr:MMPL family transporter [Acidobacteriota bacterium]
MGSRNLAAVAAAWSARHRRRTMFAWLGFVALAFAVGSLIGQRNLTDAQMGNGESGRGTAVFQKAFPFHTGEEVLVQGRNPGRTSDVTLSSAVADLVRGLRRLPTVADIESPFPVAGAGTSPVLRSADGRSALVTFYVAGNSNEAQTNVEGPLRVADAVGAAHRAVRVEEFGSASAMKALLAAYTGDFNSAEHTSLPITLVILLLAFGSLVAAGVPLLLGFTAVLAALGLIKPISHLYPVAQGQIAPVVLLVGLAVGVDYSMFYLRRKLEERHAGSDGPTALARAAATSGRAVLVSGMTVIAAMAGMLLAGNAVFTSLGMGTMLVVAVAVVGSVTVLPAAMAALGDRIEWGRVPVLARHRTEGRVRVWKWLVGGVLRRPLLSAVLSAGALLALAAPSLTMRTVDPGTTGLPRSLPIMQTYDRIEKAFPGAPSAAYLVLSARDVTAPAVRRGVAALTAAVQAGAPQLGGPVVETVSTDRTVAVVSVSLAGSGTDPRSTAALATLRG